MKKLAIIGCGRSGTRYMSKVLNAFGVTVGHEKDKENGTVDWKATIRDLDHYDAVFHQVRNPLGVIASCHGIKMSSWNIIKKAGIIEEGDSTLVKCMKYWLEWNKAAQKRAVFTYRVEEIETMLPEMFKYMGWGYNPTNFKKVKELGTTDHTGAHAKSYPSLTWEKLREEDADLAVELALLAKEYGYFSTISAEDIKAWNV
jgi:hypothetical protein